MGISEPLARYPAPSEARGMRLAMAYEDYLVWARGSVFAEWVDGEVSR